MTADVVSLMGKMPTLRDFAERCRQLALIARHPAMQAHLLALASGMERQSAANERRQAASTDREAG